MNEKNLVKNILTLLRYRDFRGGGVLIRITPYTRMLNRRIAIMTTMMMMLMKARKFILSTSVLRAYTDTDFAVFQPAVYACNRRQLPYS